MKFKNIEFLRIIMIISIMFFHMFKHRHYTLEYLYPKISLFQHIHENFAHGRNGVEGFFIVAGFFLFWTFKDKISLKDFIMKKYARLSPVIVFSTILVFIAGLFNIMKFHILGNIFSILLINQFVQPFMPIDNCILWYVSALFIGLIVYFLILKYFPQKFKIPAITILSFVAFLTLEKIQPGSFNGPTTIYHHILHIGFLRALGGIGLGCLIAAIYKKFGNIIENYKFNFTQTCLISIAEIFSLGFLIFWLYIKHPSIHPIYFVCNFTVLLLLFLIKKGIVTKFLESDIWVILGKYQYSLYVVHYVVIRIVGIAILKTHPIFCTHNPLQATMLLTGIIFAITVFAYHFVEKPCYKMFTKSHKKELSI